MKALSECNKAKQELEYVNERNKKLKQELSDKSSIISDLRTHLCSPQHIRGNISNMELTEKVLQQKQDKLRMERKIEEMRERHEREMREANEVWVGKLNYIQEYLDEKERNEQHILSNERKRIRTIVKPSLGGGGAGGRKRRQGSGKRARSAKGKGK